MEYRWKTDESNFEMPVEIILKNKKIRLQAASNWKVSNVKVKKLEDITVLKEHFYIDVINFPANISISD